MATIFFYERNLQKGKYLGNKYRYELTDMLMDVERKGTLSVLTAMFLAGLNVYLLKIGTIYIPQIPFVSVVLTLAGLILLVISVFSKRELLLLQGRTYFFKLIWMGVVGTSIPVVMVTYGVSLSMISNSFLLQTECIYSMFLSYIFLRERITKRQIFLTILSFIGITLILTNGVIRSINIGDVLFLIAPLFYQLGHVVAKGVLKKADAIIVVTYRFLIAGLMLLPVSMVLGLNPLSEFSRHSEAILIAFYASLRYSFGNYLWYYGVKCINLSKATSILIAYPMISAILGVFIVGEALSAVKIIGISLVFFSTLELSRIRSVLRE